LHGRDNRALTLANNSPICYFDGRNKEGTVNELFSVHSLPFKVEGFFSVRFAEPMVSGDDRATVINRPPVSHPAAKKN
jgi:hypothetical protein